MTPHSGRTATPGSDSRPLPFSEDAEKGLICSLLQMPGKMMELCGFRLNAGTFSVPAHGLLFETICEWPKPNEPVNFIWLKEQLHKCNQLEEVGGNEGLAALYNFVPSAANAGFYFDIVVQKYALRQAIGVCDRTRARCLDHDADPEAILKEAGQHLSRINNGRNGASKPYIQFLSPSQIKAYQPPADLVLVGDNHIVRGSVFVLGGPPGVGKSRATIGLAESGATKLGWFGYKTQTRFRTLIIQNENGLFRLQRELADIDEPLLEQFFRITSPPPYGLCFWKAEFRDQLRRFAQDFGPQLVLLDPWNAIANDERATNYLESFDIIRDVFPSGDQGPAIGIVAHTRKPAAGERASGRALLNLLCGSYVLGSIPRAVFILQSASDDVNEDRVVLTCCKNNDGALGLRSAWIRKNGLFAPVESFDWDAWDNGEKEGVKGGLFTPEKVAEILAAFSRGLPKAKLVKELKGLGASQATAYRAIDDAKKAGAIKFQKGTDSYVPMDVD